MTFQAQDGTATRFATDL